MHIFKRLSNAPWRCYLAERLICEMKKAGVDKAILVSYEPKDIVPSGWTYDSMDVDKEYYIQAYSNHKDTLIWFTDHIDIAKENYIEDVEDDVQKGAKGVKIFPAFCRYAANQQGKFGTLPSDPRYEALYKKCGDNRLRILMAFHHWNNPNLASYMGQNYVSFLEILSGLHRNSKMSNSC